MSYTRDDIVRQARTYIGTRWRQFGRDHSGVDCIGLILAVCHDLGIPYKDRPDYQRRVPDPEIFRNEIILQTNEGDPSRLLQASLLMLRQPVYPCHCGIVAMDGKTPMIIHAAMKYRKVMEEPLSQFLASIVRVREFPGLV